MAIPLVPEVPYGILGFGLEFIEPENSSEIVMGGNFEIWKDSGGKFVATLKIPIWVLGLL